MAKKKGKASRVAVAPAESETISFRVERRKAERAKAKADKEGLTLTQVLRALLDAYLAGRFTVELTAGPVEKSE